MTKPYLEKGLRKSGERLIGHPNITEAQIKGMYTAIQTIDNIVNSALNDTAEETNIGENTNPYMDYKTQGIGSSQCIFTQKPTLEDEI